MDLFNMLGRLGIGHLGIIQIIVKMQIIVMSLVINHLFFHLIFNILKLLFWDQEEFGKGLILSLVP